PVPAGPGGVEAADRGRADRADRARPRHRRRVRQDPRDDGRAHRVAAGGLVPARRRGHRGLGRAEHDPAGGMDAGVRAGRSPAPGAGAFAYAARVATHGTTTAAHMQGGLGFTIEADASLYFLRAKGWSLLGGD